jgi:hypothetical protein
MYGFVQARIKFMFVFAELHKYKTPCLLSSNHTVAPQTESKGTIPYPTFVRLSQVFVCAVSIISIGQVAVTRMSSEFPKRMLCLSRG